jgi:hypothetical protein
VGEVAANQEPAIVVSGLKPDHFYNVRVIAVGSNNFQAGSRVIRLRTFGRDGRPQLGNSRLPSNFVPDEPRTMASEIGDETGGVRSPFPLLEVPTVQEPSASPARDANSTANAGPRRNTVTRRHSPSTTSLDPSIREEVIDPKQTLPELTEKFDGIRKETEDVMALIAKEEGENKLVMDELEAEKREKRKEQRKKEEQTEKLKKDVHATDRTMRNAMQRKAQRERTLKEKQTERTKLHDNTAKWEKGVVEMRREQESFSRQMTELEEKRDRKVEQSGEENGDLQGECSRLEAELKEKREQVKELEEARKLLPGGDEDGEWREKLSEERREWYRMGMGRELQEITALETKRGRGLDEQIRILGIQVQHIPQANYNLYSQANASGVEFDHPTAHLNQRSRAGTTLSNVNIPMPAMQLPPFPQIDPAISAPAGFASSRSANAPPGFAPGPFMDHSADINRLDESSIRSAPLSPSATALLPSNLMADIDDDEPSPVSRFGPDSFFPQHRASPDNDPQSPASSGKSFSIFTSPHGSSSNLPFPPFQNDASDRMSLNAAATVPSPVEPPQNKLSGFFPFQRSRPAKPAEQDGLPFGSLRSGQSQSFPKQADDPDGLTNKRRISLTTSWGMFNRNSVGPEITEGHAPNSRMFSRSLNLFSGSHRAPGGLFPERDQSSPRPESIASAELPRPSTDSGSSWGPQPGDAATLGKSSRLWSPEAWSRNPSRRPSLHGSPSALKTTLASADDEILGEEMISNVNQVGVIGSRPPNQSKTAALGRLNPNAPAFNIASFFKSKPEKEKEKEKDGKDKSKAEKKDKAKAKDPKEKSESLQAPSFDLESPPESRKSRDGFSVHTQTSISESRDSLSLDMSFSNTPSEPTSAGLSSSFKEDNVVRKLFRKGSSSKFSIAGRLSGKESGLFKKGPSSTASGGASEKGTSMERSSIGDFEDIADEALSTSFLGRSYDSMASSPGLAPSVSGKSKEGKSRWLSNFGKKGKKEKESLDLDRAQFSELDGLAEESQSPS